MFSKPIAGILLLQLLRWHSAAYANDGECSSSNMSNTIGVTEGNVYAGVTQRCLRRVAVGLRVTCDTGEVASTVFCEINNSPTGTFAALTSVGIKGTRSAVCLWSSSVDSTLVVGCKAVGTLHRDFSGDIYTQGQSLPDHEYKPIANNVHIVKSVKQSKCRCRRLVSYASRRTK